MTEISKPFPLFRLPAIPLTKIIRNLHLREIFLVTLASKKSANIIRALLPPNCFEIQLSLYSHIYIALGNTVSWDPLVFTGPNINTIFLLKLAEHSGSLFSYRGDEKELERVVKFLLSHFAHVFNPTIQEVSFHENCSQKLMMGVLKHVKLVNRVPAVDIRIPSVSAENYKYILDEFREIPRLVLNCEVARGFWYRTEPHLFKVEDFNVEDGHWVHLEDFTNCKMVTITIEKPIYQTVSEMLRTFIKKWIDLTDWRLEQLEFCSIIDPINFREILQGVEYRSIELKETSETIEITRRSDGRKAIVKCGKAYFEFKIID